MHKLRHRSRAVLIGMSMALPVLTVATQAAEVTPLKPPGVMLEFGEWRGGVGTHLIPAPFDGLPAARWPMEGWVSMTLDDQAATLTLKPIPSAEAKVLFKPILDQVALAQRGGADTDTPLADASTGSGPYTSYIRVPGLSLKPRVVPLHRFKNGTTTLVPELGYRFQLKLGDFPYAFTVQNGFRTPDGRPYGEGTQFTLEMDGARYEYDLGGYGWDVRLIALGDFDGDGKPDFLFSLNGSNSTHQALVLSTQARPGRNAPTTYLTGVGC